MPLTRRALLAALPLGMMSQGCARKNKTQPDGRSVLRYPVNIEPATMDPTQVVEGGTGDLLQNIYEGLVGFDSQNRVVPVLAERWEISRDGLIYTFHLRASARFHNGRPVTSADMKY